MDASTPLARSHEISRKVALVFQKRMEHAQNHFRERLADTAGHDATRGVLGLSPASFEPLAGYRYALDAMQRSILFWDTLRERGTAFVEQSASGLKPALHFDYDTVLDGRTFARPVNYALLKIKPPPGVTIWDDRRPYLIIDPRAGHGPGIGGFKDDSQVGVAMRAGHPVYFVVFYRDPEPGQTLLDVCAAEEEFVRKVRALHPESPRPAIIGNCQGGWAAMMLAASNPDDTGPIVINGAPMSYWSGAWSEGEGDNPMRYSGGMLGGTWLASLTADLGNGKFDGAHLVQNFENLNPANSFWDKYYHLYANIDTEPPRFLDFERWWGGYYLMNREEIEWITRNLFVGNKLWSGDVKDPAGKGFDLRNIKSPIVLFASMGDNITPPQQAFNWVADLYGSTEEIKARGQVIIGLLHKSIGHLGIFVSGKVAQREHTQIVSVLKTIESLPPGLYAMQITERKNERGETECEVDFHEHRLEDIVERLNRFERVDEKPFKAVAEVSDFNQRAYELFMQPFVQATSNDFTAQLSRAFHPLRFQRWAFSDMNPWLAWLGPAAASIKAARKDPVDSGPYRDAEKAGSELVSASLDLYRAMRDAATEAAFFMCYGNMAAKDRADTTPAPAAADVVSDPRELPFVKEALDAISEGGYAEAFARVAFLLKRHGEPIPLARLVLQQELANDYAEFLPNLQPDQWRRIRGEQEIIARYEPEQALVTLPTLLADRVERKRILTLLDRLVADERVQRGQPTDEQRAMLERIRTVLLGKTAREPRAATLAR
jgi:pimeloyl-ACP methyl ester carboxylesterase